MRSSAVATVPYGLAPRSPNGAVRHRARPYVASLEPSGPSLRLLSHTDRRHGHHALWSAAADGLWWL